MNRIRTLAALAYICAASAFAQTMPTDSALAIPVAAQPPIEASAEPRHIEIVQRPAVNGRRAKRDADARHCLELTTNRQVHRCAEKYRARTKRAVAASKRSKTSSPESRTATAD